MSSASEPSRLPSRRELIRLAVAASALMAVMTLTLGLDLSPGIDLQVGQIAQNDIRAPRALNYTDEILTEQARQQARLNVLPQYDFTSERAITIAAEQAAAFSRRATPLDTAFAPETTAEDRQAFLETVLSDLSEDARTTLMELKPERWPAIRTEAARILDVTERAELRDSAVAEARERLAAQMAGGLSSDERELAAELIGPLLVPNSSFSETLTEQERDRQEAAVQPIVEQIVQGEIIVRNGEKVTEADLAKIHALNLDETRPDLAPIGGWLLLSGLLVALVIAWLRIFRPEYWHRNNVVLLIWLLLAFATFALQLTAGRAALPFILPMAAIGILMAVLLDAETAVVVTAVVAIIAGAVNGSLELGAYSLLGSLAGILAIRRGDRLQAFIQAGAADVRGAGGRCHRVLAARGARSHRRGPAHRRGGAVCRRRFRRRGRVVRRPRERLRAADRVPAARAGEPVAATASPAARRDARHVPPLADGRKPR